MMIITPIFEGPQIIAKQLNTSLGKLIVSLSKYIFGRRESIIISLHSAWESSLFSPQKSKIIITYNILGIYW